MKTEKKYLIYGIGLVLVTLIGVSLAYFATRIVGEQKELTVNTGDLRIVFTNGDDITGTDIEPGWSVSKTFSVENKTNSEYKYNIVLEDLVNTFTTSGFLVYKITSTSGYNMTEYEDIPKRSTETDTVLAYSVSIESKTTHNYTIEMKYLGSETVDQSEDMGKVLIGSLYISKGTIKTYTLAEAMLRDNQTISERTSFSVTNVADTTGTLFSTTSTEDSSTVYYYSGNTTNNWVKFGKENKTSCTYNGRELEHYENGKIETEAECLSSNVCEVNTLPEQNSTTLRSVKKYEHYYTVGITESACANLGGTYLSEKATWKNGPHDIYWRIIRTNEDGSVRLLYAGSNPNTVQGHIGYSKFNESYNESRYVGYMYGGTSSLEDNRLNTTDSVIKGVIDTWYKNNLLVSYDKYISKTAIYCNDRSVSSGTWKNTGSGTFNYGANTRLNKNKAPNYKCGANATSGLFETTQAIADKFSVNTTGGGNGQLTYPIALMTLDEISFAGGKAYTSLSSPYAYYYTNSAGSSIVGTSWWWLLSPSGWCFDSSLVYLVLGDDDDPGYLYDDNADSIETVRPAISISPCAKVTGSGTVADPYAIDENNSLCS